MKTADLIDYVSGLASVEKSAAKKAIGAEPGDGCDDSRSRHRAGG